MSVALLRLCGKSNCSVVSFQRQSWQTQFPPDAKEHNCFSKQESATQCSLEASEPRRVCSPGWCKHWQDWGRTDEGIAKEDLRCLLLYLSHNCLFKHGTVSVLHPDVPPVQGPQQELRRLSSCGTKSGWNKSCRFGMKRHFVLFFAIYRHSQIQRYFSEEIPTEWLFCKSQSMTSVSSELKKVLFASCKPLAAMSLRRLEAWKVSGIIDQMDTNPKFVEN